MRLFLATFLFILYSVTSCSFALTSDFYGSKIVRIEYKNNIHGYHVQVLWMPIEFSKTGGDYVIGPAILKFRDAKNGDVFTFTTNYFSVMSNKLSLKSKCKLKTVKNAEDCHEDISAINQDQIKLVYQEQKPDPKLADSGFGASNEPFFFQDVNFDGKEELIVAEFGEGQRFRTAFKVYQIGVPSLYQITDKEPFKSLDDGSKIDYKNKKIFVDRSGGACDSVYETYTYDESKKDSDDGPIRLSDVTETTTASGKCQTFEYKVIDGVRHLVSTSSD